MRLPLLGHCGGVSVLELPLRSICGGKFRKRLIRVHEFTLILTADPNEEESARLYSVFNDGTLVTTAGVPQIHFHREVPSLEDAIGSALADVRKAGFDVVRVEIEPANVFTEQSSEIAL